MSTFTATVGIYPLPVSVTVPAGKTAIKYEQTAARDHMVDLVPGTYPINWRFSPEGYPTGGWASIPAIAHAHISPTVLFGGVALASEQRGGEHETYNLHFYAHEVEGRFERNGFELGYDD